MDDEGIIQIGQRKIRESQNKLVFLVGKLINWLTCGKTLILSDMPCKFSRNFFFHDSYFSENYNSQNTRSDFKRTQSLSLRR